MIHKELIISGPPNIDTIPKDMSLVKYLIECIKKRKPTDIYCIDGASGETITCGELLDKVIKLSHVLKGLGVEMGDAVAIISENSTNFLIPLWAIIYIGGCANLLNPLYTPGELKHALDMSKPKIIFCSNIALKNVREIRNEFDCIQNIVLLDTTSKDQNTFDEDTLEALLEVPPVASDTVEVHDPNWDQKVALIMLSSGTTGLPKGVMMTHANCKFTIGFLGDTNYTGIGPDDVAITVLPFFHIFGLSAMFIAALTSTKLVTIPMFNPELYLRCIQTYKVTTIFAVPPIVAFLVKHPLARNSDLSSLKLIMCGGGCLGHDIQEEFIKMHPNISIRQIYGLTETTGACTISVGKNLDKLGTVGLVVPGAEAIIWDDDLGENVGVNSTGELCFRTRTVMKGYIGREINDIDQYGFYHTGDFGYYDEDNYFYIISRIKELIKYKGFQVAPLELEDLLMSHSSIKECGVLGVPDERAGELPAALVVLQNGFQLTEKEIIDFVAERISVQKRLHGGAKFVQFIPRNATGKILRSELLKLYNAS